MKASSRIGILGGTFDPIHCGHLAIARAALERLGLDRVVFIPAGRPWLKTAAERRITDSAHRLAMVELAVVRIPDFTISTIDIDRPGPTYTIDTLVELLRQADGDTELYLILGMDSVRELRRWRQPERIFDLATVVAVSRPLVDDLAADEIARTFPAAPRKGDRPPWAADAYQRHRHPRPGGRWTLDRRPGAGGGDRLHSGTPAVSLR